MLDSGHGCPVNSLTRLKFLGLSADLPQFNLAIETTGEQEITVYGRAQACDTWWHQISVAASHGGPTDRGCGRVCRHPMAISDQVHQPSGLGCEGSYLAICPAGDDALTIWHEVKTVAEG